MKSFLLTVLAVVMPILANATAQEPDIVIYKGDTLKLLSLPLQQRDDIIRMDMFGKSDSILSCGLGRGYIAEWGIIDDELFLSNIYGFDHSKRVKADLNSLFGATCINNKVKASWFTGPLYIAQGKLICYYDDGYSEIYEKEKILTVEYGKIVKEEIGDNTKTHISAFKRDQNAVASFIYCNINWQNLPDLGDDGYRVYLRFQSGALPKPNNIEIVRGAKNDLFNQEAIRIVESFPDWDVIYLHGKVMVVSWTQPIIFDTKHKEMYCPHNQPPR